MSESPQLIKVLCSNCISDVSQLYIKCAECSDIKICMQCYALGVEPNGHLRTHKYTICDIGTFSLFESGWSALEERQLIDSVEQFGLGNWEDVAEHIGGKSAKDVENHYMSIYIDSYLGRCVVPQDIPNRMTDHTPSIHDSVQLPHVEVSKEQQMELAYMPNRDDFEYEFDNDAENLVSSIFVNPDDDELDKGLKLAKVEMYHLKLMERQKRKGIAREYRLVEKFFNSQPESASKQERHLYHKLRCCAQFMKCDQLTGLVQGLTKVNQLKRKVARLKNYRKNGITKLNGGGEFESACFKRLKLKEKSHKVQQTDVKKETLSLIADGDDVDLHGTELSRLPGSDLLTASEKLQCKTMSITPAKYLTSKILIIKDASLKCCGLQSKPRYSTIIDKSQRRRIHHFLEESGWLPT